VRIFRVVSIVSFIENKFTTVGWLMANTVTVTATKDTMCIATNVLKADDVGS